MFQLERQNQIIDFLQKNNYSTVKKISEFIHTSEATVRRDISVLENSGKIIRTYGGVMLSTYKNEVVPVTLRDNSNSEKKEQIAKKAAALIHDNEVVIFDSSSTVRRICKHILNRKNLKIITNNLRVCEELKDSDITVYCTGGMLMKNRECFLGAAVNEFLNGINADSVFFSLQGLSDNGDINDSSDEEVILRRLMMAKSKNKYFLCDSSKIGTEHTFTLCNISDITKVISDIPVEKA